MLTRWSATRAKQKKAIDQVPHTESVLLLIVAKEIDLWYACHTEFRPALFVSSRFSLISGHSATFTEFPLAICTKRTQFTWPIIEIDARQYGFNCGTTRTRLDFKTNELMNDFECDFD